jgi:hypothetical protein
MSRMRAADAVMSCCPGARFSGARSSACARPASWPPASPRPAAHGLVRIRPTSRRPVRSTPAPGRHDRRSRFSRPSHLRLPQGHAAAAAPPCPLPPGLAHPLYWYVFRWDAATLFGWSFDPGRDILLCNHILSLRRLRWP